MLFLIRAHCVFFILFSFTLLCTPVLYADTPEKANGIQPGFFQKSSEDDTSLSSLANFPSGFNTDTNAFWGGIGKLIFFTILLTLALVIALKFLKKYKLLPGSSGTLIQVTETQMIAPKKFVQIVEVAGHFFVLGISDNNITKIGELNDPETISLVKTEQSIVVSKKKKGNFNFQTQLARFLKPNESDQSRRDFERTRKKNRSNFLKEQRTRLNKMNPNQKQGK